jgi:hypothetical protein
MAHGVLPTEQCVPVGDGCVEETTLRVRVLLSKVVQQALDLVLIP